MKSPNASNVSKPAQFSLPHIRLSRSVAFLALIGLIVSGFYIASFASSAGSPSIKERSPVPSNVGALPDANSRVRVLPKSTTMAGPAPPSSSETVATFASDCTTPKTSFNVGDTVCVVAGGIPIDPNFPRSLKWATTDSTVVRETTITSDPQTDSLLLTATSTVNSRTIDNRGTWQVVVLNPFFFFPEASTTFTVRDPSNPAADLAVNTTGSPSGVQAGSQAVFQLQVNNYGPDSAANVVFTDVIPDNTTFGGLVQTSGPAFSCTPLPAVGGTGTVTCTIASLAPGDVAGFDLAFGVNAGTPTGTIISNTATVSSDTADPNTNDNSSTASTTVTSAGTGTGGTLCSVGCPDDIITQANTTQNNQEGAIVHFSPPSGNTECGAIVVSHCNDCFFPTGITTVTATAATGDGCSFTVTVNAAASGTTTISCPANQTANADSNCQATVAVGTATATGNNVTVIGTRTDGQPMYTCDAGGTNCTRNSSDAPFSAGTTTITWIAYSHDTPGPYASAGDEEAHRTGSASCTQTVTVNDVTPPNIGATDQTISAGADCLAAVPDYSSTVTDNCACASSDTSESCAGHSHITVVQAPPPGTMVPPGQYPVVIVANDGSSNNGGAGNTSTKTITLTVKDTTPPTITCPANVTTNTDPGQCSAVVNPGTATATDNCDTNPTITGTRSDGRPLTDTYPKGTTTITWKARDASGNESTCQQTITVEDHENPVIICPAPIVQGNDPGTCSATVNPGQPTVTDNCDSHPTVTSSRSDGQGMGAPYPKGTTTITWTATDASGNHASCTQTVTVVDNEAPTFTFTGTQSMWPPNHKYWNFPMTALVASVHDNCDGTIPVSSVVITKVTSDEAENGPGSGNTLNDIVIAADCKSVQLRSEREGGGNGRVYTIFFSVSDAAGNVGTGTTKVVVPHNPGQTAVDSGPHYTVTSNCP